MLESWALAASYQMNRRNITFSVATALVTLWLLHGQSQTPAATPVTNIPVTSKPIANDGAFERPQPQATNPQQVVQPPPPGASDAEKWAWWREMRQKDSLFEYKMPISFYGRVEDDQGQPVAGASIDFSWVNLSQAGTTQQHTTSDAAGLFSLTRAVGKALTVQVRKVGYKDYYSKNQSSFEYDMFADPKYHVSNPAKPVIFVLRKNREAEPLIVRKNQEAELKPGESKSFTIGPNGAAIIVERLAGEDPKGPWNARVRVPGGGLMLTTEEFPFEAPESGYVEAIEITGETPHPSLWMGNQGALFFVKTPQGYSRVTVHYVPNMSWVYVDSFFNPKYGSRNLEFDPSKTIKP
jgi:hypothetical protein